MNRLAAIAAVAALAVGAATSACGPPRHDGRDPSIAVCAGGWRVIESDILSDTPDGVKRILAVTHKLGPTSPDALDAYNKQLETELAAKLKELQHDDPGTQIVGVAARLAPEVGGYAMTQTDVNWLAALTANDLTEMHVPGTFTKDVGITYVGEGGDIQPGALASFIFEGDNGCTYVAAGNG